MADDDKSKGKAGGKPEGDSDTDGLKSALEKERARATEAENQLKQLRLQMAEKAKESDASKSELEKLAERVKAAEEKQAEADARALRAEVAQAKGLTAAQAKRLQGASREELEADADELVEAFGTKADDSKTAAKANGSGTGRPKEKLRPGAAPDGEAPVNTESAGKIADSILARDF